MLGNRCFRRFLHTQRLQFGLKFYLFVERAEGVCIRGFGLEGLQANLNRDGRVNGHHLPAVTGGFGMFDEILAPLLLLDLIHSGQEFFNRVIGSQKLFGGFFTDAGHARHIIRSVAHEAQHLNDSAWFNPKALFYFSFANALVFHRVEDGHMRVDQLTKIFVAAHQHHIQALGL